MKRISKITEEERIAADDFVKDEELSYLIKNEKVLLDERQYFSWDSPSSSKNKPTTLLSEDIDSLLPDLDLDGLFDDLDTPSLSAPYQPTTSEHDEANHEEYIESLDDDSIPFVSEYSDSDLSAEANEPDWLDLAGEADEFDDLATSTKILKLKELLTEQNVHSRLP